MTFPPTRRYSAEELKELLSYWEHEVKHSSNVRPRQTCEVIRQASEDAARLEQIEQWAEANCSCCGNPECELGHDLCTACRLRTWLSPRPSLREER